LTQFLWLTGFELAIGRCTFSLTSKIYVPARPPARPPTRTSRPRQWERTRFNYQRSSKETIPKSQQKDKKKKEKKGKEVAYKGVGQEGPGM
jgi:hypothetical protein